MASDNYKRFYEKRKIWMKSLDSKDRHSIVNQISNIIWDAGVYRIITEARSLAVRDRNSNFQPNRIIHDFIDDSYYTSQLIAIRRLWENTKPKGERGVFSLLYLINDIKDNRELLRRENILKARDRSLEFEDEDLREKPLDRELNKYIDKLCGVSSCNRSLEDTINSDIFDSLEEIFELLSFDALRVHANKYIAHAATLESRSSVKGGLNSTTLCQLHIAHHALCCITNAISKLLSGTGISFLATEDFDHFKYIDKPLVSTKNVCILEEVWNDYRTEVDNWSNSTTNTYS